MEVNYVDQYIRRKKGGAGYSGGDADASGAAAGPALDRAARGTQGVQQFVDRTDALHLQLATFEDKMLNLTKLVKLSQTLADEKETELRKENHELKVRLRRQEQMNSKLSGEMHEMQDRLSSMFSQSLQSTSSQWKAELTETNKVLRETTRYVDQKTEETRNQLLDQILTQTDSMLNARIEDLKEDSIDRLKAAASEHCSSLDSLQRRFDVLEKQTLEQLKQQSEDRMNVVTTAMKDAIMAEVRSCVRALNDDVHEELAHLSEGLQKVDARCSALEVHLGEFVKSYRETSDQQTAKVDEAAAGLKELVALQDQTRTVVGGELERTKDWATRNMHRLKKHIDTLNADICALKESHVEMTGSMERLKRQHGDERERLSALLSTKTKEAAMLYNMVDQEIHGLQEITKHHGGNPPPGRMSPAPPAASGNTSRRSNEGFSEMAFKASSTTTAQHQEARRETGSLYDDLAFERQRGRSISPSKR